MLIVAEIICYSIEKVPNRGGLVPFFMQIVGVIIGQLRKMAYICAVKTRDTIWQNTTKHGSLVS